MSTHIADDLPRLLTGEATRDEVMGAAAHLRECPDCQQDLVSAVVAHSSLASAHRFAPEVIAWQETPAAETDEAAAAATGALPDLSTVFEKARQESADRSATSPQARRSRRLLVAAAAAGLIIGGGGAAAGYQLSSGSGTPAGAPVALAAYDVGTHSASARLGSGRLTVDAASLPTLGADQRYEVWLTNAERTAMQPVGWIGTDGRATLTVPQNLAAKFSAIEVSVQHLDAADYDYSGTSVLRGSYRK